MGMAAIIIIAILVSVACGIWTTVIATQKNRNGAVWFIAGFFLSIIGIAIVMKVRPINRSGWS